MSTSTRFWNWMAARYSRQPIADEASYEKKLEMTRAHFTPDMHVVEFGCGTGSTAVVHAPHVASYLGVDVAENMIAIAREKAERAGVNQLEFVVGTLEEADLAEKSFDAALAMSILHLVPDLDATLATVARIVKPGGFFASSTLCADDVGGAFRLIAKVMTWIPFVPSVGAFSRADLEARIERAGFAIEERFEQRSGVVFLIARRL